MASFKTVFLAAATSLSSFIVQSQGQEVYANSYAPAYVECPSNIQWIRKANGLSVAETEWVHGRKKVALKALAEYLERLQIENFDVSQWLEHMYQSNYEDVPVIGWANSGGGAASAYTGTAGLQPLDDRVPAAVEQRTGGLLQSLTYMSGLSGGSWPTISFALTDFPTVEEIVEIWKPWIDRYSATNATQYAAPFSDLFEDVAAKAEAGFDVGVADLLGRVFGYQFTPGYKGGLNVTLSGVVNQTKFQTYEMPMPILEVIQLTPDDVEYYGLEVPSANQTIYDLTPFEFGAWGGSVKAFTPTQYLGTRLVNGSAINESACVLGFDRGSYMIGTSSGAWNFWEIEDKSNGTLASFAKRSLSTSKLRVTSLQQRRRRDEVTPVSTLIEIDEAFEEYFNLTVNETAYSKFPNPFYGLTSVAAANIVNLTDFEFVDGSESGQTVPFWSLIQPARKPAFLIGWDDDSTSGEYTWSNGTNLYNTFVQAQAKGIPFPIVPRYETFVNRGYNIRPTFFGCDTKLTTSGDSRSPIVLYLANAPYSAYTNYSAGVYTLSKLEMKDVLTNGFNQVTQGNGTLDKEWPVCLGCAAIERSLEKVGIETPAQCQRCFERYCWDGMSNDTAPGVVNPSLVLDPGVGYEEWLDAHFYWNSTMNS